MRSAVAAAWLGACVVVASSATALRGDEVTYTLPGTDVVLTIPGTIRFLGPMVSIRNGQFGAIYFHRDEVDYVRTPPDRDAIPKQIRDATAKKDAEALLAAARLALKAGRPDWFRESLASLDGFAPQHPTVARLTKFLRAYDAALPPWDRTALAQKIFGPNPTTASFESPRCLLYVVDATPDAASKALAMERVALMERVSETFFFLLVFDGVELSLPDRPLVGVWCADAADFQKLRELHGPQLSEATGFYAPEPGVSIFHDQSTGPRFAPYLSFVAAMQQERKQAKAQNHPNLDEITRRAETTQLVARLAKERADVETIVHESVHQLLALSDIFPANSHPPRSLHEGLATYFEGYDGKTWAGPGALLRERYARLAELSARPDSYSLADVLDDGTLVGGTKLEPRDAYAYAWGATLFLAETRPADFFRFCRTVGRESEAASLPPERLRQLATDALGADLVALDAEWRTYLQALAPPKPAPADSP